MSVVLDASAILAFLQEEPGSEVVEDSMADGSMCGAANWSEVAQKVRAARRDWDLVRAGEGLSLADRLCLALAERVDVDVLTADATLGSDGRVRQIR